MTAALPDTYPRPLAPGDVDTVALTLENDFGRSRGAYGTLLHQHLLDALDRGDYRAFTVWPGGGEPSAVLFRGASGTLVPAGPAAATAALAAAAEDAGWRVMIGARTAVEAVLEASPRGLFKRRPSARVQRFMIAERHTLTASPPPGLSLRRARLSDLEQVTEFACRLHVEDRMGPPIPRSGRTAVRSRAREQIRRGSSWVVDDGGVVAKLDLALCSPRRGAQIAGVYVDAGHRGRGIGRTAVAALARQLLGDGLPGVTLHVRADNEPALRAYERAGFTTRSDLVLALR